MFETFKADLARYRAYGDSWISITSNPAVWCIAWYRVGRTLYDPRRPRAMMLPLRALHFAGSIFVDAFLHMRLNVRAHIGPGLLIAHCGQITLHPDVVIGNHCDLAHGVTLGTRGVGQHGVPRLGDRVYIGTNAVLIGPIHVGSGARVGANSLVNRDVPPECTVLGVPARIIADRRTVQQDVRDMPSLADVS